MIQRAASRPRAFGALDCRALSKRSCLWPKISNRSLRRCTRQEAKARAPQDEMGKRNRADRHPGHRELFHARADRQHESRCKYAISSRDWSYKWLTPEDSKETSHSVMRCGWRMRLRGRIIRLCV